MLKFLDGPAAGVRLMCARAPLLLRVVRGVEGGWDALDQLGDTPAEGEAVHVYLKASDDGTVHIDYTDRDGRRRGRWEQCASYRLYDQQPDAATARDTTAWREWCEAQRARLEQPRPQKEGES